MFFASLPASGQALVVTDPNPLARPSPLTVYEIGDAAKAWDSCEYVIEGEADKLMLESLRDLYNGDHATLRVVMLKDLYEILEKVFDRCRDVGNLVLQIVFKHS